MTMTAASPPSDGLTPVSLARSPRKQVPRYPSSLQKANGHSPSPHQRSTPSVEDGRMSSPPLGDIPRPRQHADPAPSSTPPRRPLSTASASSVSSASSSTRLSSSPRPQGPRNMTPPRTRRRSSRIVTELESSLSRSTSTEALNEGEGPTMKAEYKGLGLTVDVSGGMRRASESGLRTARPRQARPSLPVDVNRSTATSPASAGSSSSSLPFPIASSRSSPITATTQMSPRRRVASKSAIRPRPSLSTHSSDDAAALPTFNVSQPTPVRSRAYVHSTERSDASGSTSPLEPSLLQTGRTIRPGSRRTSYQMARSPSSDASSGRDSVISEFGVWAPDASSHPGQHETPTKSAEGLGVEQKPQSGNASSSISSDTGAMLRPRSPDGFAARVPLPTSFESSASTKPPAISVAIPHRPTSTSTSPYVSPRLAAPPRISPRKSSMAFGDSPEFDYYAITSNNNVFLGNPIHEDTDTQPKPDYTPRKISASSVRKIRRSSNDIGREWKLYSKEMEVAQTTSLASQTPDREPTKPYRSPRNHAGLTISPPPRPPSRTPSASSIARPSPPIPVKSPLRRLGRTSSGLSDNARTAHNSAQPGGISGDRSPATDAGTPTSLHSAGGINKRSDPDLAGSTSFHSSGMTPLEVPAPFPDVSTRTTPPDAPDEIRFTSMTIASMYSQDSPAATPRGWSDDVSVSTSKSPPSSGSSFGWGKQRDSTSHKTVENDATLRRSTSLPRLAMPDKDLPLLPCDTPSTGTPSANTPSSASLGAMAGHSPLLARTPNNIASPSRSPSMPMMNTTPRKAARLLGLEDTTARNDSRSMSRSQTSPSPLLPQSRVASPPSVNTSSPSGSSKRRHLIREIATTERAYANDLALIRDAYMTRYTRPTSAISLSEYNNAAAGTSNSNVSASPGMSETSRRSSVYTYQTAETKRSSGYESSTPWLAPNGASTTLLTKSPLMDPTAGSYFPPVPVPAAPVSASLQTPQRHARNISGTSIASTNMPPPVGKPLSPADVKVVFMNLDQLAAAAEELALAFEQSMGDEPEKVEKGKEGENGSDKLGEVFTNLMPRFRGLYLSYCSRQSAAALRLVELQADPSYRAYLDDCWRQVKPFTRAWNLDSMLIKPVQRVTKYPLLFEDLLSCTTPVHPDYFSIRSAAELSRAVAGEIDEAKRRKDVVAGIVSRKPQTSTSTTSKDSKSGGLGKGLKLFRKEKSITSLPASISTTDLPPASISRASLDYYRELVRDFEQYQICVKRLGQEMLFWTAAAKEICTIQDGLINVWMRVVQLDGNDVDQRMVAFRKTLAGIVNTAWTPLNNEVQDSLMPHLVKLLDSATNPSKVILKRNSKSPDYTRYFSLVEGRRPVDRTIQQSAKDFVVLHTQLVEELPAFLEGYMRIFDLVIVAFAKAQARYHAAVRDQTGKYITEQLRRKASRRLSGSIGVGGVHEIKPADGSVLEGPNLNSAEGIVKAWQEAWAPYAEAMQHFECTRPARNVANRIASFNDRPGSHVQQSSYQGQPSSPMPLSPGIRVTSNLTTSRPSSPSPTTPFTRARSTSLLGGRETPVQSPNKESKFSILRRDTYNKGHKSKASHSSVNGLMLPPPSPIREGPRLGVPSTTDPSQRYSFGLPTISPDSSKSVFGLGWSTSKPGSPSARAISDPFNSATGPFSNLKLNSSSASLVSNPGLGIRDPTSPERERERVRRSSSQRSTVSRLSDRSARHRKTSSLVSESSWSARQSSMPEQDTAQGWKNEKVLYQCACVADFNPKEYGDKRYRDLSFLPMGTGDLFDVLHEVGRFHELPGFPYPQLGMDDDGVLVARSEDGSVGLVICSFLEPLPYAS